ncbi:MAG: hypothetical protein NT011_03010 [Kiritimatiellaeota bacterium]|nr:hypothetical protein [Kiritimatiellota bacterium]
MNAAAYPCVFFDDFSDGIWKKYTGNPVIVRSQPWAESDYICEPNLVYRDGLFHVWFSQMYPPDSNRLCALGYATSKDGFAWTKHPANPVLRPVHCEVKRPHVFEHKGMYYCFGIDDEESKKGPSTMRRWVSKDGIKWSDEQLVMTADQEWEGKRLSNMAVIVDNDGTWQMLYTRGDPWPGEKVKSAFGYARSCDGVHWSKHKSNPVNIDGYGGDPFLIQIGKCYYAWHSLLVGGMLRIDCRCSDDMMNWRRIGNGPNFNITQPWEQGVPEEEGGTTSGWYGHITDATICEAEGKVYLMYQGAQTPLGVATFEGTFTDLANRLQQPPLSRWKESPYGMVEGGTLKITDNGTDRAPLVAKIPDVQDHYLMESRIQCYAGATHRMSVVIRYGDTNTLARFWLHDAKHTFYQECINGLFSLPINVGSNHACDSAWHDWAMEVAGSTNRLVIDGQLVGECRTSNALIKKLSSLPRHIGFSVLDTYASIAYVRIQRT